MLQPMNDLLNEIRNLKNVIRTTILTPQSPYAFAPKLKFYYKGFSRSYKVVQKQGNQFCSKVLHILIYSKIFLVLLESKGYQKDFKNKSKL